MRIDYSKPAADILRESFSRMENDACLYAEQAQKAELLNACENRSACILCGMPLNGLVFSHRSIPFVMCKECGHVQTKAMPPEGYPGISFQHVYPSVSPEEYESRKSRIYRPKLEWIFSCLEELNYTTNDLKEMTWTELGAGAGYFLSTLADAGVRNIRGLEKDPALVERANTALGGEKVICFRQELNAAPALFPSDIYVAFFVLEHVATPRLFFETLAAAPKETVFIFSVPVFGFSCLIENVFSHNYARNLDGVIHTQLYTDQSIAYCLSLAGFARAAEWVFGQDASDFTRCIMSSLKKSYNSNEHFSRMQHSLVQLEEPLQQCLDRLRLSDQRHIISIKKDF